MSLQERLREANGPEAYAQLDAIHAQRALENGLIHRAVVSALPEHASPSGVVSQEAAQNVHHIAVKQVTGEFPVVVNTRQPEQTN